MLKSRTADLGTLQKCCTELFNFKTWHPNIAWLVDGGENAIKNAIKTWFADSQNPDGFAKKHRDVFIDQLVDSIVGVWPLLGYFRNHLKNYLSSSVIIASSANQNVTIDNATENAILNGVRDFIVSKVPTSMVIGGYDHTKTGNERYPNLNSYIYWDKVVLDRQEVQNVYSTLNARNELVKALQSAPFFGTYLTWGETMEHVGDANLFKVGTNALFTSQSGYVKSDGNIDVDWSTIREWLFTDASTNLSGESLLDALVMTQIYRPLFFKHDNYEKFTSDQTKYWCETQKTFIDHEGSPHQLVWADGEFGTVDPELSGLGESVEFEDGYVDQDSIQYIKQNNIVQYDVVSNPIVVRNNSFVYNDIQFYTTWHNSGEYAGKVKSIYFNEFQKDIENAAKKATIDQDGYFTIDLNFIDYTGNKTSFNGINNEDGIKYRFQVESQSDGTVAVVGVDSTEVFDGESSEHKYNEYRQQVVDGLFNLEGIWFRLLKDDNGYCGIEYAYVEDSLLRREIVSLDGSAQFKRWGLSFQFVYGESGETSVVVVKRLSIVANDHVVDEWCSFLDEEHEIAGDKTFEWNLSNEILRLRAAYVTQIDSLGNGVLYDGVLNKSSFKLCSRNLNEGGSVTTALCLKVIGQEGNVEKEFDLGTLYDSTMLTVTGKVIKGNMNSDGLFQENVGGSYTAVKRDVNGQNNWLNLVWVENATWNSNNFVQTVGEIDRFGNVEGDAPPGTLQIKFNSAYKDVPELVQMTPVESGVESVESTVNQYVIKVVAGDYDQENTYNVV